MNATPHKSRRWSGHAGILCLSAITFLAGCHHKQLPPQLPPVVVTPDLPPPVPDSEPMKSPPPATVQTAPPVKVTQAKPKRTPKKPVPAKPSATETPANTEVAAANSSAETSPIGELSAGGDTNPQLHQEAADLILSSEHRLDSFATTAPTQQQAQIRKVRYFLRQARQALGTGDAEGAKTLATKAKLLMDDFEK